MNPARRLALLTLALPLAACPPRAAPPPAPSAPALAHYRVREARCAAPGGDLGVALDGRCLPVVVSAHGWDERAAELTADPGPGDALAELGTEGCEPASNVVRGDGAAFVRALCGGQRGAVPGFVVRLDGARPLRRVAVPASGGARLAFVAGARPLVVATLNGVGTMAFDARTLAGLAGFERMGGWFNATTWGPAPSPDGRWIAVPDPYGLRVDFVRAVDLAVVATLPVREIAARNQGPGRVTWSEGGLEVSTFPLPYE